MATNDSTPRTIEIQLTKGYVAIVDEQDADLALLKWYPAIKANKKIYVWRKTPLVPMDQKKTIHLHRSIMERMIGRELTSSEIVDHKNNNPLDNRRSNLRMASKKTNSQNAKRRSDNSSGFKGVTLSFGKWTAEIKVNGNRIRLGRYETPETAYSAYCEAAKKYFGEFARLE